MLGSPVRGIRAKSLRASLPAPVGGLNARDSIAAMDPKDAVIMDNWFPTPSDVMVRKGYVRHVTGFAAGSIDTLMAYTSGSTSKLFACFYNNGGATAAVYDVTSSGAVGASVKSGLTNAKYQYINVSNASGTNYLMAVNGADKLIGYNGAWYQDGDGSNDITGFDTATASNINLFKNRVWFVEKNSLSLWYLGTGNVSGPATEFTLNSVAKKGGSIVAMYTWTIDAGEGIDDYAVFVTNQGEVIVYGGTDPASSATWALRGVFTIGTPIGTRCGTPVAGDILLITQDGVVPMSTALQSSRVQPKAAITDKIQKIISDAVTTYGSNYGWQLVQFPQANMIFLNVPITQSSTSVTSVQYAMNVITKSWGKFVDVNANCWVIYGDEPYFGGCDSAGNVFVGQFWTGYSDYDVNGTAINISTDCQQAFNYFRQPGQMKKWNMMRPIFLASQNPLAYGNINVDFDDTDPSPTILFNPVSGSVFGSALFGSAVFGGGLTVQKFWQGCTGVGYCAAPRIITETRDTEIHWLSTDFLYESGGYI